MTCCSSWSVLSSGPAAAAREVNCSMRREFSLRRPHTSSWAPRSHGPVVDWVTWVPRIDLTAFLTFLVSQGGCGVGAGGGASLSSPT